MTAKYIVTHVRGSSSLVNSSLTGFFDVSRLLLYLFRNVAPPKLTVSLKTQELTFLISLLIQFVFSLLLVRDTLSEPFGILRLSFIKKSPSSFVSSHL